MGCGSGKAIADIISNKEPELDFAFTDNYSNNLDSLNHHSRFRDFFTH